MTTELTLLSRVRFRGQEITSPGVRGLLALLAGELRTGCSSARLAEELWPDQRPEHPSKALQILVTRARARLGPEVIVTTPTGYRLSLAADTVDTSAVLISASASARYAREGDHEAALAHAEAGLALWTGTDGLPSASDPLSALRAERASTYRSLARARALALSRLGRATEALEALSDLARERPLDEEILLELLRCEAATLGPSIALVRYEAHRRSLREDLGSEPGPALQSAYQTLLSGTAPLVRHGVPHEPNPLLGRDGDVAAVARLLRGSRVTSIVGPGGLGKTRLANVVSRQAEQRVVHLVGLAGVTSDEDVLGEVASALGVGGPADPLKVLAGALGPGPVLLVLDNCEHVIEGVADLVRGLVSLTRDLRILTTSRAPLGLSSEAVYLLPELDSPTVAELFGQRARAARPGVELSGELVRELCDHLDGLPLAVELAAALVRVMSVGEIALGLNDRFALLRSGARDAPQRHQTLFAVVDWSWNLLTPGAREGMRALSVFPGGFTAEAAGHLLGDDQVLRVLGDLVDQSLLKVTDTSAGTRFRMLETVREFATARRDEAGETERVVRAFLAWARDFGVAQHAFPFGAEPFSAVDRIRAEQDNLLLALRHGLDRVDGGTVVATSAVLGALWTIESNFSRLATLARDTSWVLSHYRPEPALVEVTRTASVLATVNAFLMRGSRVGRPMVSLRRLPAAPSHTLVGAIESVLQILVQVPGGGLPALLALCGTDDPLLAGVANGVISYVRESENDPEGALRAARRMLTALEHQRTPWILAVAHSRIGELCLQLGLADEARRHFLATQSVLEALGALSVVRVQWAMVLAYLQCGAIDEAEQLLERAVRYSGDEMGGLVMFDVCVRAEILLARGEIDAGLHLWRRAADRLAIDGQPWALEVQAVTVVSHAHHGRLELVENIVRELPQLLLTTITDPAPASPASFVDLPVCGALLLALGMVDLEHGSGFGVRLMALAEAMRFSRGFQPTMSPARARDLAENVDATAYAEAVASYAGLDPDALRAAALAAVAAFADVSGSDRA